MQGNYYGCNIFQQETKQPGELTSLSPRDTENEERGPDLSKDDLVELAKTAEEAAEG